MDGTDNQSHVVVVDSAGYLWSGDLPDSWDPSRHLVQLRNARMLLPKFMQQELAVALAVNMTLNGMANIRSGGEPPTDAGPVCPSAYISATHMFATTREIADEFSEMPVWEA